MLGVLRLLGFYTIVYEGTSKVFVLFGNVLETITEPGGHGIGLYSAAEMQALSSPVDLTFDPGPWRLDVDGAIPEA